jgi:hypothetical protein
VLKKAYNENMSTFKLFVPMCRNFESRTRGVFMRQIEKLEDLEERIRSLMKEMDEENREWFLQALEDLVFKYEKKVGI